MGRKPLSLSMDEVARIYSQSKGNLKKFYSENDNIRFAMGYQTFQRIVERAEGSKKNVQILRELLLTDFMNGSEDYSHLKKLVDMIYDFNIEKNVFKWDKIIQFCFKHKLGRFSNGLSSELLGLS